MGAIQEWMDAQDPFVKWYSPLFIFLILISEVMSEAFPKVRHRYHPLYKFPIPNDSSWFDMYQSRDKAEVQLKDFLVAIYGAELVDSFSPAYAVFQKMKKLKEDGQSLENFTPEEAQSVMEAFQKLILMATDLANEWITEGTIKKSCKESLLKLGAEKPIETSYFLFVHVPCLFTYQMLPTQLYSQACLGDFEALRKLLSIDRLLFQDSNLLKWINEYSFNSKLKFKKLQTAAYAPQSKIHQRSILLSVIRYMSAFLTSIDKPITAQGILDLLAAIDEEAGTKFHAQIIKEYPNKTRHDPERDARSLGRELQPDRNLYRKYYFTTDIKK